MDKKKTGIIVSAIGGIILAFIIDYIWYTFEEDPGDIASSTAVLAMFIAFFGLIVIIIKRLISNKKRKADKEETAAPAKRSVCCLLTLCLAMALTGLAIFAKAKHDNKDRETGIEYLENKGWNEITVCTVYSDNPAENEQTYYIIYKDGQYSAVTQEAKQQSYYAPELYSVTRDDYYFKGVQYNARISKRGEFLYFNF